jgi:hypothetical protein
VKLVEGGPERHLALAELIGRLSFATEEGVVIEIDRCARAMRRLVAVDDLSLEIETAACSDSSVERRRQDDHHPHDDGAPRADLGHRAPRRTRHRRAPEAAKASPATCPITRICTTS